MMRAFTASVLLILALSPAGLADDLELNCENPTSTMEYDFCADRTAKAADDELNRAYRKLRGTLDDKDRGLLADAQRAWIAFRDAECAFDLADKDGSGHNVAHLECLTRLTRARAKQLAEPQ